MKLFFSLLISIITLQVYAQDKIHLLDHSLIEAKVLEVTKQTITFKKYANLDGPKYEYGVREVWFIQYENGSVDSFNTGAVNHTAKNNSLKSLHHIITILPANVLGGPNFGKSIYYAGISYEQLLFKNYIGIRAIGKTSTKEGIYSVGIQAKYYPTTAHGFIKYHVGIGTEYLAFEYKQAMVAIYPPIPSVKLPSHYYSIYCTNGIAINVTNHFQISAEALLGTYFSTEYDHSIIAGAGIGFGIRF